MKIAISVPDDVFKAAELASKRLKLSRSRFYAQAVREYLRKVGGEDVTRRLNKVHDQESSLDPAMEAMSLEVLRREEW